MLLYPRCTLRGTQQPCAPSAPCSTCSNGCSSTPHWKRGRCPLLLLGGLQGILRGFDQATNLILDECFERVYSLKVE